MNFFVFNRSVSVTCAMSEALMFWKKYMTLILNRFFFNGDTNNKKDLGYDCSVQNQPCTCSLNFLLTYFMTMINKRSGEDLFFSLKGSILLSYRDLAMMLMVSLKQNKKAFLADLQIQIKSPIDLQNTCKIE